MPWGAYMCVSFYVSRSKLAEVCVFYTWLYTEPMHVHFPAYDIYACLHGTCMPAWDLHACVSECRCVWVGMVWIHMCMSACLTGVCECLHIHIVQDRACENILHMRTREHICINGQYCAYVYAQLLSCVWLFVTPWTVTRQASLSMEFSMDRNIRVGCHFLLQGIFPTLGLNLRILQLLCGQPDSLPLSHMGSLENILCWPKPSFRFFHTI